MLQHEVLTAPTATHRLVIPTRPRTNSPQTDTLMGQGAQGQGNGTASPCHAAAHPHPTKNAPESCQGCTGVGAPGERGAAGQLNTHPDSDHCLRGYRDSQEDIEGT